MSDIGTNTAGPSGPEGSGQQAQGTPPATGGDAGPGEELGEGGKSALEKSRAEIKALKAENKTLKPLAEQFRQLEESQKSEAQKATEAQAKLQSDNAKLQQKLWRSEVALEKGLTPGQARRLSGETLEELSADADDLLGELAPNGRRPAPTKGQGASGANQSDGQNPADAELRRRAHVAKGQIPS